MKTTTLNIKREEKNFLWGKFLSILGECPISPYHFPTTGAGVSRIDICLCSDYSGAKYRRVEVRNVILVGFLSDHRTGCSTPRFFNHCRCSRWDSETPVRGIPGLVPCFPGCRSTGFLRPVNVRVAPVLTRSVLNPSATRITLMSNYSVMQPFTQTKIPIWKGNTS